MLLGRTSFNYLILLALSFSLLSACQTAVTEKSFSTQVIQGLSENGMAYISKARENGDLQRIMQEIASGNGLLIDRAYLMRNSLHDEERSQLRSALSQALAKRPEKILALMPAQYSYDELCRGPELQADVQRQDYLNNSIESLREAKLKYKSRQQQECLTRLQSSLRALG